MQQPDYEAFFRNYVDVFNRSLRHGVDADAIRASYAEYFVSAGFGEVVRGGANDEKYAEALREGAGFYQAIGLQGMRLEKVEVTPIDAWHDMVRPYFHADYKKKDGEALPIEFDVVYMLQRREGGPKIFAFVVGDEMGIYRQHGLVDEKGKPV
jgi:hypothetical protein